MPNVMAALPNIGGALCSMLHFRWRPLPECRAVRCQDAKLGDGFYGSNDWTISVKALKEVVVLSIRLLSHQVHLTVLQYYKVHMHAIYSQTLNNTQKWI